MMIFSFFGGQIRTPSCHRRFSVMPLKLTRSPADVPLSHGGSQKRATPPKSHAYELFYTTFCERVTGNAIIKTTNFEGDDDTAHLCARHDIRYKATVTSVR